MSFYKPLNITALGQVPQVFAKSPSWLLWKEGLAETEGAKPKKLPFYANHRARSGTLDTPADRAKLVTLQEAVSAFREKPKRYAGVGVALGPLPGTNLVLAGIDLDNCINSDGVIAPKARKVLDAVPTAYAEISPSGTGLKIFGTGTFASVATAAYEIYSGGRFFTVTGNVIDG